MSFPFLLSCYFFAANIDENVKPKRRIWESLFCCWRQRSASISSRRSKSVQNGSIDGLQTQTIGQATGLTGSGGQNRYLLPQIRHSDMHKKCMVIDLDETLVHSSFKVSLIINKDSFHVTSFSFQPIPNADFVVPVEIDGTVHQVYVLKRPYVDEFLKKMGELYECVLFTASLAKYADPVADLLDQ